MDSLDRDHYLLIDTARSVLMMDSTELMPNASVAVMRAFLTMRAPIGAINVRLNEILGYNRHERLRLGVGLETNDKVSKKIQVGANIGYGTGDEVWKYQGDLLLCFDQRQRLNLYVKYSKDIRELGAVSFFEQDRRTAFEMIRSWQGSLFDEERMVKAVLHAQLSTDISTQIGYEASIDKPLYDYRFLNIGKALDQYQMSDLSLALKYAKGQKVDNMFGANIPLGEGIPLVKVKYAYAHNALGGNVSYQRIDLFVRFQADYSLGRSDWTVRAGYIDSAVPYSRLITGWGNSMLVLNLDRHFQTMSLYEYVSDRSAAVFYQHNFGSILWQSRWSSPEPIIYQNSGIGELHHLEVHALVALQTIDKGYHEAGVGLNNLLRFNYFNWGMMELGVGGYYRYDSNRHHHEKKNVAVRMNAFLRL